MHQVNLITDMMSLASKLKKKVRDTAFVLFSNMLY